MARERPELEEERSQVTSQINENEKNLEDIGNKILNVLYTSKGNILEDGFIKSGHGCVNSTQSSTNTLNVFARSRQNLMCLCGAGASPGSGTATAVFAAAAAT